MTNKRDYDFLTRRIGELANPSNIDLHSRPFATSQSAITRIGNHITALEEFFGDEAPLEYMGQLLAFRRGGSWDSCFLADAEGQRKLLPRKTSIYVANTMRAHGWEPGELKHLRDDLLTPNPDQAFVALTDLAGGVVELSWGKSLQVSQEKLTYLDLTQEELQDRLDVFTGDDPLQVIVGPEGPA